MEIHLLDVGTTKYGDCILITNNGRSILIDGAHPGDSKRIAGQLRKLLKSGAGPIAIDLLIVTHCHADHIGCLPNLVTTGQLNPKFALVADEKVRWPNPGLAATALSGEEKLATLLQEEDHTDLSNSKLKTFMIETLAVGPAYSDMLSYMTRTKVKIVRYKGDPKALNVVAITSKFKDFGLEVLGPNKAQLDACTKVIQRQSAAVMASAATLGFSSLTDSQVLAQYKSFNTALGIATTALGGDQVGAALNNTSIVVIVSANGKKALFAGDMQFALPQVSALNGQSGIMDKLFKTVIKKGPYAFVKLTHHSSHNGIEAGQLNTYLSQGKTKLYGHSGGRNDRSHPHVETLKLLKSKKSKLLYARTDRTGLVSVKLSQQSPAFAPGTKTNDFTPN